MNWPEVPIKDVCLLAADCVNKTAPIVDYETPYRMLRTTNVRGGFVDAENTRFVTEETFSKWTRRGIPEKGDVILTREAPLGDVGRLTSDNTVFLGQRLFMYRADPEKLNSKYLAYILQSPLVQGRIKSKGFGATVEHARVGDCENLLIPVPDLRVQERIGETLSAYDDLIENNKRRIELLEESARQLYKEWFVRFRFPGHEHVKVIDGVPEGWVKTTADQAMDILSGGTPKTFVPDYWDGEIGFFTPKDTTDSVYVSTTEKMITTLGLEKCASNLYPKNTLFITARGTVGNLNLALKPMAMNQSCYALVAREPINQLYLYFAMQAGIQQVKSRAVGAVFDAIIKDTFKVIPFLIPPKGHVEEFTDFVQPILAQIVTLMISTERLVQARDLLLPKLMCGEIAV